MQLKHIGCKTYLSCNLLQLELVRRDLIARPARVNFFGHKNRLFIFFNDVPDLAIIQRSTQPGNYISESY